MASESVNALSLKDFPTLCRLGVVGNLSDGRLLESFLAGDKETAEASFAALVDRHGPMVLRVCRQILGNADDAQDAFQATFLVLVQRAGTVRKRDSVASWLYGIALRLARRARTDAARRHVHERRCAATSREQDMAPEDEPECCWPDLHDELRRLPEKYRESVVLCYLQGLSTQAAAQRLIYNAFLSCRGNGVINEAGCWDYLVGMTSAAIHVAQVPESGWPCPLPPPLGCNLSTNRKRKPKWRRCVVASIAVGPSAILTGSRTGPSDWGSNARFGPVEDRRNNRRLATFTCTLCILQIWWLSPFTPPASESSSSTRVSRPPPFG